MADAVDLVITQDPRAAIEFKYPREPRETNAAWTQHLGELLKDFYRLAHMPTDFDERWCLRLVSPRVQCYLTGVGDRLSVRLAQRPGHTTVLHAQDVRRLSATPRVRPGLVLFHPVAREAEGFSLAVGLSLPLGGPDQVSALPAENLP